MSFREMRLIVFFDLPTIKRENRIDYLKFRKFLVKNGFIMLQESIYTKLCLNSTNVDSMKTKLEKVKPSDGLVQILTITEKQYNSMTNLVGTSYTNIENSIERLIIL